MKRNPRKNPYRAEIERLLGKMTLEEKISCCHAASKFTNGGVPRLGIEPIHMSDGPHGVREEICADSWDAVGGEADYATYLPTGTALAATWSRKCANLFGSVLGAEARDRGKDMILGPGVNIIRNPLCGRNFEYYSEDPYLAGEVAVSAIRAIQKQGTSACVKHFALNSQELNRGEVDTLCDERTLREIYLPAFEKAVKDGGVLAVMGAYNRFNGQHCCQNDFLLNHILKNEWGFRGVVVSDWAGVHDTYESARGGMDIEMGTGRIPYDEDYLGRPFREAIEKYQIDPAVLDDKVRRILEVMFAIGMLGGRKRPEGARNTDAHREAALQIAEKAIVLLKNERHTLPLSPKKIRRLLVVGDNAVREHHLGGHSSAVKTRHEVTPLEGIRNFLADSDIQIDFVQGYPDTGTGENFAPAMMGLTDAGAGVRGWECTFFEDRTVRKATHRRLIEQPQFAEATDLPEELRDKDYAAEITGEFTPDKSGKWTFFLEGASQANLNCGSIVWINACKGSGSAVASSIMELEAGHTYRLNIHLHEYHDMPMQKVRLSVMYGEPQATLRHSRIVEMAKEADAVLFFGGLNHSFDCEGSDRKDMALHDGQNELIQELAQVNARLAVVLVGGSPMELPWIEQVPAVVQMWYAGQEAGHAIAEVLFGAVNPSGKLPFTFPVSFAESVVGRNQDYTTERCYYKENVFVGYRWHDWNKVKPLFAFGHGLSYTKFEISSARLVTPSRRKTAAVEVTVSNCGKVAGREVIQLYVEPPKVSGINRPVRALAAFAEVFLKPGRSKKVRLEVEERSFCYFDPVDRIWRKAKGKYLFRVGSSSAKLPVKLSFNLEKEA
ncbi:MAG: glycoside hydrolase family 3 C-terminal domain-containing protein [Victivallaceae bacterium]|nr:glycoside hydrolase family 3 C-terminal domain-containing protein [Victivallaceae bacterium]